MTDPSTPAEWQDAVNMAELWSLVDSARQYGLITGGPVVDLARCNEILAAGKARGWVPRRADVDALIQRAVRETS